MQSQVASCKLQVVASVASQSSQVPPSATVSTWLCVCVCVLASNHMLCQHGSPQKDDVTASQCCRRASLQLESLKGREWQRRRQRGRAVLVFVFVFSQKIRLNFIHSSRPQAIQTTSTLASTPSCRYWQVTPLIPPSLLSSYVNFNSGHCPVLPASLALWRIRKQLQILHKKSSIYRQHSQLHTYIHTYLWRAFLRKMLISCSLTSIGFRAFLLLRLNLTVLLPFYSALYTKRNVPTHLAQAIWNRCIPIMKWKSFESPPSPFFTPASRLNPVKSWAKRESDRNTIARYCHSLHNARELTWFYWEYPKLTHMESFPFIIMESASKTTL